MPTGGAAGGRFPRTGSPGERSRLLHEKIAPYLHPSLEYILHPDFANGHDRVISVREALQIMGFKAEFRFPLKTPLMDRYQMVADCVSPNVSTTIANLLESIVDGGEESA